LRAIWVAAIGGLVVGHILWLAGISIAIATRTVSSWVLVVAAVSMVFGGVPVGPAYLAGAVVSDRARCDVPIGR
jgi:hypothetical protein